MSIGNGTANGAKNGAGKYSGLKQQKYDNIKELLDDLRQLAFTATFAYDGDRTVRCIDNGEIYPDEELAVIDVYRREGAKNPHDYAVVYALESDSGVRGTLVDLTGGADKIFRSA